MRPSVEMSIFEEELDRHMSMRSSRSGDGDARGQHGVVSDVVLDTISLMQRELRTVRETVASRSSEALDVHPLREELERMKKELDERNDEIARLRELRKDREDTLNAYSRIRERTSRRDVEENQPSPSLSNVTSVGGVLKPIPKSPTARKAMGVPVTYSSKTSLIPVADSSSKPSRQKFSSSATAEIMQFHQAQEDAKERAKSAPRMRPSSNQDVLALEWEDTRSRRDDRRRSEVPRTITSGEEGGGGRERQRSHSVKEEREMSTRRIKEKLRKLAVPEYKIRLLLDSSSSSPLLVSPPSPPSPLSFALHLRLFPHALGVAS